MSKLKETVDGARNDILKAISGAQDAVDGPIERFRREAGVTIPDLSGIPREELVGSVQVLIQDLQKSQQAFTQMRMATNRTLALIKRAGSNITSSEVHEIVQKEIAKLTERNNAKLPIAWQNPAEKGLKRKGNVTHSVSCSKIPKKAKEMKKEAISNNCSKDKISVSQIIFYSSHKSSVVKSKTVF